MKHHFSATLVVTDIGGHGSGGTKWIETTTFANF